MGPYLAKPETSIHTHDEENDRFCFCTSEMQGWRKTQEVSWLPLSALYSKAFSCSTLLLTLRFVALLRSHVLIRCCGARVWYQVF